MLTERNIVRQSSKVSPESRSRLKGHRPAILWFTGLSGSGKSTLAQELEFLLNGMGIHTCVLDGDNVRHGLNRDLGFSSEDRKENIRRIGEVAALFVEAGLVAITAFISPFREDRRRARDLVGKDEFIEIYAKCSIDVCRARDPKRLYKRAATGEIADFTGISHPYEEPLNPEIILETDSVSIDVCVREIVNVLQRRGIVPTGPTTLCDRF